MRKELTVWALHENPSSSNQWNTYFSFWNDGNIYIHVWMWMLKKTDGKACLHHIGNIDDDSIVEIM